MCGLKTCIYVSKTVRSYTSYEVEIKTKNGKVMMHLSLEVLTAVKMWIVVFWVVTSCCLLFGISVLEESVASIFCVDVEAVCSSEMLETLKRLHGVQFRRPQLTKIFYVRK
jgi:hypothetical protein